MKKAALVAALLLLSLKGWSQTYSNANLNGTYSFTFSQPTTYNWSKTFTCPTNSQITYPVFASITGASVIYGTLTFNGAGGASFAFTQTGEENPTASSNTISVTWNSSCEVTVVNDGHVMYLPAAKITQSGTYSIQSDGIGTMSESGSTQSQILLLAATTGGISNTILITNPQVNGKNVGGGIAIHQ